MCFSVFTFVKVFDLKVAIYVGTNIYGHKGMLRLLRLQIHAEAGPRRGEKGAWDLMGLGANGPGIQWAWDPMDLESIHTLGSNDLGSNGPGIQRAWDPMACSLVEDLFWFWSL